MKYSEKIISRFESQHNRPHRVGFMDGDGDLQTRFDPVFVEMVLKELDAKAAAVQGFRYIFAERNYNDECALEQV